MTTKEQEVAEILLTKIRDGDTMSISAYLEFMRAVEIRKRVTDQDKPKTYYPPFTPPLTYQNPNYQNPWPTTQPMCQGGSLGSQPAGTSVSYTNHGNQVNL